MELRVSKHRMISKKTVATGLVDGASANTPAGFGTRYGLAGAIDPVADEVFVFVVVEDALGAQPVRYGPCSTTPTPVSRWAHSA